MRKSEYSTLAGLLTAVRQCRACEQHLPLGPRPILQVGDGARILIVGQAPGARVHATGTPWDDPSGERLRKWMGIDAARFYDASQVAIIPMGYCYPGRGNGGDLPPRRECATLWLDHLLAKLPQIELTLLIGLYAQRHFLGSRRKLSLTETVKAWREFAPDFLPLPHPSARNTPWFQRNPWFEHELLPVLRERIKWGHTVNLRVPPVAVAAVHLAAGSSVSTSTPQIIASDPAPGSLDGNVAGQATDYVVMPPEPPA